MHVVAIRELRGDAVERGRALAALLGDSACEARWRLGGRGPCVVAIRADAEAAFVLAASLDDAGFEALVFEYEVPVQVIPRTFTIRPDGIQATLRDGRPFALVFARIDLLLRGTRVVTDVRTEVSRERRFSAARALVSGGLVLTKTVARETRRETEEREGFLLVRARGVSEILFLETELLYDGLGAAMAPTRAASFARLVNLMRNHAAHAGFDDRLLTRAGQAAVLGGLLEPEAHLEVATALLGRVLLEARAGSAASGARGASHPLDG